MCGWGLQCMRPYGIVLTRLTIQRLPLQQTRNNSVLTATIKMTTMPAAISKLPTPIDYNNNNKIKPGQFWFCNIICFCLLYCYMFVIHSQLNNLCSRNFEAFLFEKDTIIYSLKNVTMSLSTLSRRITY